MSLRERMNRRTELPALPQDTYSELVDSLFGTVGSFSAGAVAGLVLPVVSYVRTGEPIFIRLAALIGVTAAFRIGLMVAYRNRSSKSDARQWELLYAIGAVVFMLLIGFTGATLFWMRADQVSLLFGMTILLGCAGAVAARNAGRPTIVLCQISSLLVPLCLAFWSYADRWYILLSALMALILASVISTTRFLHAYLLEALLSGREARIQKERFDTALNTMSQGLCMFNKSGVLTVVNDCLPKLLGLPDNLVGSTMSHFVAAIVERWKLTEAESRVFADRFETHFKVAASRIMSVTLGAQIFDFRFDRMEEGGLVIIIEEVTEARTAAKKIEQMAMFDSLTGLPNRIQFREKAQTAIETPGVAEGSGFTVLYIDLDLFKEVNDTLGHPVGDSLLCEVSRRLAASVGDGRLVARFGGDEFVVLASPRLGKEELGTFCDRLIRTLSAPYEIGGNHIIIGASIGTASMPQDGMSADEILKNADLALYHAKANGRGHYSHFDRAMEAQMNNRRRLETDLRSAIANQELEVHYQPIIDITKGHVTTYEALVRWRHPSKGMISPAVFIPIAEETGLIVEIGNWVLNRACRDAANWPDDIRVAVNFSPIQFRRSNVVDIVASALRTSRLASDRLDIEITEAIVIQDADSTLLVMENLRRLGVRLSLDDFGTGYSSLSYLSRFPFQKIKIDRSFVKDMNAKSYAIIVAIVHLAKGLGMSLVVEGVETSEQLQILYDAGAHEIQGFLFSAAKPLSELGEWTDAAIKERLTRAA